MKEILQKKNLPKILCTCICCILLVLLYWMIFSFSEQDGETSGSLSMRISERLVELAAVVLGGGWTESFKEGLAFYFEHPLRKIAHFCEYAGMGALIFGIWRPWKKGDRKMILISVAWIALSAAADEFHQTFIPGRWGSPWDVLLDTAGGGFGLLFCSFVLWLICRKKDRT